MLPRKLYDFNVIIDGFSQAGIATEIIVPKLTRKMDDHQGGGMLGPVKLDYGMDAMQIEFTLAQFDREVLRRWGVVNAAGINCRFLGAARADADGQTEAIEISVRGRWQEVDFGTAKRGDATALKVTMPLTYFRYLSDGSELIEIDLVNNIERVGGVDRMAEVRRAISMN